MSSWDHGIRCPLENCACLYFSFGGMQAHIRKAHAVPPRIASVLATLAVEMIRHEIRMKVAQYTTEKGVIRTMTLPPQEKKEIEGYR